MKRIIEILNSLEWIEYKEYIQDYIDNNDIDKKYYELLCNHGFNLNL